jgi:protein-S-isoprenylcysteine O-methyltransferase Ste14
VTEIGARPRFSKRWLKSTSNRTFLVWPVVLFATEALLQQGMPRLDYWALPLLAWGYLQYRWVGVYRTRLGGGGPGLSNPPDRIVDQGPYRWVRNPMYLGHLIFFAGLAWLLRSWAALAVLACHLVWFDRRARGDERHLAERFGESYREYCRRVRRWIPGVY